MKILMERHHVDIPAKDKKVKDDTYLQNLRQVNIYRQLCNVSFVMPYFFKEQKIFFFKTKNKVQSSKSLLAPVVRRWRLLSFL